MQHQSSRNPGKTAGVLLTSARVVASTPAWGNHHILRLHTPEVAERIMPGEFLLLYCGATPQEIAARRENPLSDAAGLERLQRRPLLGRPFGAFEIDRARGDVSVLFRLAGIGTRELAALEAGADITIMAPLGKGFNLEKERPALLVAGGIGIAPLAALAAELRSRGRQTVLLAGARDVASFPLPLDEGRGGAGSRAGVSLIHQLGVLSEVASEAGEPGTFKGLVTGLLDEWLAKPEAVDFEAFICGPQIMMARVSDMLLEAGLDGQALLEERMGCGIGACMACVCKTRVPGSGKSTYSRVCADGPVFDIREVVW